MPIEDPMFELLAVAAFLLSLAAWRGRSRLAALEREVADLRQELGRITGVAIEPAGRRGLPAAAAAGHPPPRKTILFKPAVTGAASFSGEGDLPQEAVEKAARGEPASVKARVAEAPQPSESPAPKESLESRLGARWAVWVGGIALALGGVFMVKYSIDAGLLSPGVRLALAALFGLALAAAGEFIRRRAVPRIVPAFGNAMIPGVLTAAGAVTLFGVVYAAYGVYGFIGPTGAFLLLALVSVGTVGLSLLHGQALAGLGLLAAMETPLLVDTEAPDGWSLVAYLLVAFAATLAAAHRRGWRVVPSLANLGLGLWAFFIVLSNGAVSPTPAMLAMPVMLAGNGLFAGLRRRGDETPGDAAAGPRETWRGVLRPLLLPLVLTASLSAALAALVIASPLFGPGGRADVAQFALIVAAMAVLGAVERQAASAALLSAVTALAGLWSLMPSTLSFLPETGLPLAAVEASTLIAAALVLSVVFLLAGALAIHRRIADDPRLAALWSGIVAAVPAAIVALSFLMLGTLGFDPLHGLFALGCGAALLALADVFSRRKAAGLPAVQALLTAGSLAAFAVGLHALTDGVWTTMLLAALGLAYVVAARIRPWPVMPWMMVAAALGVLGRIAWEPSIVGPLSLGTTPVVNALAAGYGVPAALLALSAYEMRRWSSIRVRNLLQALACLFALLTAAILVRHAMNGGRLDSGMPTLAEQSIYTLIVIGASAIMMLLDLRSPGTVLRYGSMALGILSMLSVLAAHLVGLNPYFTGEPLGPWPLLDLLLIGYLLPGLAYAALAWLAQGRRPPPYIAALAVSGGVLVFAWATLCVRRAWQGPGIADWKGFLAGETYTYSVVWLAIGVAMLWLGARFNARAIRITSAVLVIVAVIKVFLIDMAHLEGFLRALSFIGLGGVLIGIGLFYQRLLSARPPASAAAAAPADPAPAERA
ncbi:DUF2339 domain-containing protein [Ensifer soli]|uniref:DUF2339 domain-containing protein n=1 Tax=Ciceribacter sp. sgz301302 TaxID=3342379 RepID=UPI0035B93181